jgi:hypothetical protein
MKLYIIHHKVIIFLMSRLSYFFRSFYFFCQKYCKSNFRLSYILFLFHKVFSDSYLFLVINITGFIKQGTNDSKKEFTL